MKSTFIKNDNTHTPYVQLDAYACTSCWECIEACPNKVIDKSFLYIGSTIIHKQVLMYNASKCTGCTKCIQACKFNAIDIYRH